MSVTSSIATRRTPRRTIPKRSPLAVVLVASLLLGAAPQDCSRGSFHTQARGKTKTAALVADPVATPGGVEGQDPRLVAKRAIAASDENALRLLISWCNVDAYLLSLGSMVAKESEDPRCVALREYMAERA